MGSPNARTFAEERRAAIITMLESAESVQVADLARLFSVSAVTVRSDLDALQKAGKLRRTHGGAVSLRRALTVSVQDQRVNVNARAKQRIAEAALGLVHDGETLLIDSGTTALEFVRALEARSNITVITADITIADYIDESLPAVDVILLGGALRKGHRYLSGMLALRTLEMLHADTAILSPGGFLAQRGFMTDYTQMAELKAAFIKSADRSVILMDKSKQDTGCLARFAGLSDVDVVVTDGPLSPEMEAAINELPTVSRPQLILAEPAPAERN